jgi:L-aspartate oxidase
MDKLATDVLVIGAGAAGIRAAAQASMAGVGVTLVTDVKPADGGATFSELSPGWGIQALIGQERTADNLETFYEDVMRVGLGCCDPRLVRILVEDSGARIRDLMSYGLKFKIGADGNYVRARGCFSDVERAFLVRDMVNIRGTFLSILQQVPVRIVTGYATDLINDDGCCLGAWIGLPSGELLQIKAQATILTTGGGSGIYKNHMSSWGSRGEGYALAHRAGAELANMEFIQFALGLNTNGSREFLPIGQLDQGGKIVNPDGCDVLKRYLPDDDQRRRAITQRRHHMPFSCRDLSGLLDIAVAEARQLDKHLYWQNGGSKEERIEVVHFAHAFNGGIKINEEAESSLAGLYAAGEVAAGSHGADRIGGCMMTATQVLGKRAGQYAASRAKKLKGKHLPDSPDKKPPTPPPISTDAGTNQELLELKQGIREQMTRHAQILRSENGLLCCLNYLAGARQYVEDLKLKGNFGYVVYAKLRNLITSSKLVTESALARKESRGAHFRKDFPAELI